MEAYGCCSLHGMGNAGSNSAAARVAVVPWANSSTDEELAFRDEEVKKAVGNSVAEELFKRKDEICFLSHRRCRGLLTNLRHSTTNPSEQHHSKDGEVRHLPHDIALLKYLDDLHTKLSQTRQEADHDTGRGFEVVPWVLEEMKDTAKDMVDKWKVALLSVGGGRFTTPTFSQ